MWERFSSLSNQEKKNKKLKIPILNNFNFFFFIINIPESKWKESVWEKGHFFYYLQINGHKNIWMRRKNIEKLIIISKEISMIFLSLLLFLSVVKRKLPRCCIATPMTRNTEWFRRIHVFFLRIGTCSIWSWRFTHVYSLCFVVSGRFEAFYSAIILDILTKLLLLLLLFSFSIIAVTEGVLDGKTIFDSCEAFVDLLPACLFTKL